MSAVKEVAQRRRHTALEDIGDDMAVSRLAADTERETEAQRTNLDSTALSTSKFSRECGGESDFWSKGSELFREDQGVR